MKKKNEFQLHGLLLINKDKELSSFDVLRVLKRKLRTNQVGHTGTLDPMATGVLPVCFGDATKFVQYIMAQEKQYIAKIQVGRSTNTYDAEGEFTESLPIESIKIDQDQIKQVLSLFKGEMKQKPPMFSALKVNGKRLYELARKGIEIEIESREIEIYGIDLLDLEMKAGFYPEFEVKVDCSKGTYIRSLAVDLGKNLGYPAHLTALIRTKTGHFDLDRCLSLSQIPDLSLVDHDAIDEDIDLKQALSKFIPLVNILDHLPVYLCNEIEISALMLGKQIKINRDLAEEQVDLKDRFEGRLWINQERSEQLSLIRLINTKGQLVSLGQIEGDFFKVMKNFKTFDFQEHLR
jgi:tRNA pseudouridine55 synthase